MNNEPRHNKIKDAHILLCEASKLYIITTFLGFSKHPDEEFLRNIEGRLLTDVLNETNGRSVIK
jgi:hypothetical protein